jgi:tetratricopeptide (TPR) repeat protein
MNLPETLPQLTAKAYYDAALAGVDMHLVADALEPLKKQCESANDILQILNLLDDFVALNSHSSLQYLALDLRANVVKKVIEEYSADIVIAARQSTTASWLKLQKYFVELLTGWRIHMAFQLAEGIYDLINFNEQDRGELLGISRYMCQRRWVEVYTYLEGWVNGEGLNAAEKAQVISMMAAIQLHYIGDRVLAIQYADEAIALAPESFYPQEVRARIELENGSIEKAKSQYESLVRLFPQESGGRNGIGLCFERELDYEKAEHWYNIAIELSPGNTVGYLNKIALYGASETLYAKEKDNIAKWVAFIDYLKPESKYEVRLDAGYSCQKAGDIQNAEWWFDQAIALDPASVEGYTAKGYLCLEKMGSIQDEAENHQLINNAEGYFIKAVQLGPSCFDGYWGMKALYQRFERFDEAIKWLDKSYSWCPMFNELVQHEKSYLYERKDEWGRAIESTAAGAALKQDDAYMQSQLKLVTDRLAAAAAGKYGEAFNRLDAEPTPIAIECHSDVCRLFLQENSYDFTPVFLEKINAFRTSFQQQFGITIPALKFRIYEWVNPAYNFYTSFFETTVLAGANILFGKRLVMADAATLSNAKLPYEPVNVRYSYMPMNWIEPADEQLALEHKLEVKDPVDLIFQHLRFYIWSKMSRFCRLNDAIIAEWVENEPANIANTFMQLLHLLLDYKVPVTQKGELLSACKQGIAEGRNLQQVAFGLMERPAFAPVYAGSNNAFTYMTIGQDISEKIINTYGTTTAGQWFTKIEPNTCQELLAAIRNIGIHENLRFITNDARMAFSLSNIVQMEFPYLEFVPEQHPVYREAGINNPQLTALSFL